MEALPVASVTDVRLACEDRDAAERALEAALAGVRAPRHVAAGERWTLRTVIRASGSGSRVEASLERDDGVVIARRIVEQRQAHCLPLAQAAATWASLVVDDELARATDRGPPPVSEAIATTPPPPVTKALYVDEPRVAFGEPDAPRVRDDAHGRVFGVGMFLRSGIWSDLGFAGVAPFASFAVSRRLFFRPSVAVGTAVVESLTAYGGRLDGCFRVEGERSWDEVVQHRRALQLDACVGGESGAVGRSGGDLRPYGQVGPSAILRGDLGGGAAVELRGVLSVNVLHLPVVGGGAELGFSFGLPDGVKPGVVARRSTR